MTEVPQPGQYNKPRATEARVYEEIIKETCDSESEEDENHKEKDKEKEMDGSCNDGICARPYVRDDCMCKRFGRCGRGD